MKRPFLSWNATVPLISLMPSHRRRLHASIIAATCTHREQGLAPAVPRIAVLPGADGQLAEDQPRQALADWLFREDNPLTARVIVNRIWQQHFGRSLFGNPSDVGVVAAGPTHPELLDWLAGYLRDHQWSLKALHRQILLSATYQQSSMLDAESPDATPPERGAQATAWQDRLQRDPHNRAVQSISPTAAGRRGHSRQSVVGGWFTQWTSCRSERDARSA